jgi:threonine synthase
MKFYSTKNKAHKVDVKTAVLNSLPPDNGLYMPERIVPLDKYILDNIDEFTFQELSYNICHQFLSEDLSDKVIKNIISSSITFDAPIVHLSEHLKSLELWHGPSLAFKDFGARFMAALMSKLVEGEDRELNILVATSGDTGGAVAAGFFNVPNINVTILYPSGKVSPLQEKQLTTLGSNINAIEIKGTFDDCQSLVKKAFLDHDLNQSLNLSSANSINIARLIPQSFYYFEAFKQIDKSLRNDILFCVPSGNFGNLTAGLIAKKMGLPFKKMIAATNINNVVPRYLESGVYSPVSSFTTISNAMDVGNPSNFQRMLDLFDNSHQKMAKWIKPYFFDDIITRQSMLSVYKKYGYTADPHGAVGFQACETYLKDYPESILINLETAHPSKFLNVMTSIDIDVDIPERLKILENKKKKANLMTADFSSFKSYLLSQ